MKHLILISLTALITSCVNDFDAELDLPGDESFSIHKKGPSISLDEKKFPEPQF